MNSTPWLVGAVREGPARRLVDAFNRRFTRLHTRVYVGSRGRIGHHWAGVPSLILHTSGRRTGTTRSVVLVYAKEGADYLVVASNFGGHLAPGWLHNIRADSNASINVGRRSLKVTADVVMPGEARYIRLFEIANTNNRRRYDRYRALTPRPIPVVVLTPVL